MMRKGCAGGGEDGRAVEVEVDRSDGAFLPPPERAGASVGRNIFRYPLSVALMRTHFALFFPLFGLVGLAGGRWLHLSGFCVIVWLFG